MSKENLDKKTQGQKKEEKKPLVIKPSNSFSALASFRLWNTPDSSPIPQPSANSSILILDPETKKYFLPLDENIRFYRDHDLEQTKFFTREKCLRYAENFDEYARIVDAFAQETRAPLPALFNDDINRQSSDSERYIIELISNALDATRKRAERSEPKLPLENLQLKINITITKGQLTIEEHGIGMTAKKLFKNYSQPRKTQIKKTNTTEEKSAAEKNAIEDKKAITTKVTVSTEAATTTGHIGQHGLGRFTTLRIIGDEKAGIFINTNAEKHFSYRYAIKFLEKRHCFRVEKNSAQIKGNPGTFIVVESKTIDPERLIPKITRYFQYRDGQKIFLQRKQINQKVNVRRINEILEIDENPSAVSGVSILMEGVLVKEIPYRAQNGLAVIWNFTQQALLENREEIVLDEQLILQIFILIDAVDQLPPGQQIPYLNTIAVAIHDLSRDNVRPSSEAKIEPGPSKSSDSAQEKKSEIKSSYEPAKDLIKKVREKLQQLINHFKVKLIPDDDFYSSLEIDDSIVKVHPQIISQDWQAAISVPAVGWSDNEWPVFIVPMRDEKLLVRKGEAIYLSASLYEKVMSYGYEAAFSILNRLFSIDPKKIPHRWSHNQSTILPRLQLAEKNASLEVKENTTTLATQQKEQQKEAKESKSQVTSNPSETSSALGGDAKEEKNKLPPSQQVVVNDTKEVKMIEMLEKSSPKAQLIAALCRHYPDIKQEILESLDEEKLALLNEMPMVHALGPYPNDEVLEVVGWFLEFYSKRYYQGEWYYFFKSNKGEDSIFLYNNQWQLLQYKRHEHLKYYLYHVEQDPIPPMPVNYLICSRVKENSQTWSALIHNSTKSIRIKRNDINTFSPIIRNHYLVKFHDESYELWIVNDYNNSIKKINLTARRYYDPMLLFNPDKFQGFRESHLIVQEGNVPSLHCSHLIDPEAGIFEIQISASKIQIFRISDSLEAKEEKSNLNSADIPVFEMDFSGTLEKIAFRQGRNQTAYILIQYSNGDHLFQFNLKNFSCSLISDRGHGSIPNIPQNPGVKCYFYVTPENDLYILDNTHVCERIKGSFLDSVFTTPTNEIFYLSRTGTKWNIKEFFIFCADLVKDTPGKINFYGSESDGYLNFTFDLNDKSYVAIIYPNGRNIYMINSSRLKNSQIFSVPGGLQVTTEDDKVWLVNESNVSPYVNYRTSRSTDRHNLICLSDKKSSYSDDRKESQITEQFKASQSDASDNNTDFRIYNHYIKPWLPIYFKTGKKYSKDCQHISGLGLIGRLVPDKLSLFQTPTVERLQHPNTWRNIPTLQQHFAELIQIPYQALGKAQQTALIQYARCLSFVELIPELFNQLLPFMAELHYIPKAKEQQDYLKLLMDLKRRNVSDEFKRTLILLVDCVYFIASHYLSHNFCQRLLLLTNHVGIDSLVLLHQTLIKEKNSNFPLDQDHI